MEDEGNHGNDDTRCFILSTLAALHTSRVACVLCQSPMLVFDRYPLVDGTFFLSPRQHSKCCLEVSWIVITNHDMLNQHDWFWYLLLTTTSNYLGPVRFISVAYFDGWGTSIYFGGSGSFINRGARQMKAEIITLAFRIERKMYACKRIVY
jgi:hypothetical protein